MGPKSRVFRVTRVPSTEMTVAAMKIHRCDSAVLPSKLVVDLSGALIKVKNSDRAEELLHFPKSLVCDGKLAGYVRTSNHG